MSGLSGGCLCGAVRYEGRGALEGVEVCHCGDCRKWIGGPLMSLRFADGIELSGRENVRWYASSDWAERGSCATCGSALFWRMKGAGDQVACAAGQLDDQTALNGVIEHIFVDAKPSYYEFADDTPRLTGAEVIARFQQKQEEARRAAGSDPHE